LLASGGAAVDGDQTVGSASNFVYFYFSAPFSLVANTAYRVVQEPISATNVNTQQIPIPSNIYRSAIPAGTLCWQTSFTTAGGWVDVDTSYPYLDVLLDQISDGIAYGNSPVAKVQSFSRGAPY
jgi:hypothetical protein